MLSICRFEDIVNIGSGIDEDIEDHASNVDALIIVRVVIAVVVVVAFAATRSQL